LKIDGRCNQLAPEGTPDLLQKRTTEVTLSWRRGARRQFTNTNVIIFDRTPSQVLDASGTAFEPSLTRIAKTNLMSPAKALMEDQDDD
jgi:hypothetical protein